MNKAAQKDTSVVVTTQKQLVSSIAALASGDTLAFDTEFIRERTYYPQLCLLQIANASHVACIDVFALENIQPLWDLIMDPARTKIAHSARQDLELILHETNRLPAPLFDTQVAAAVTGYALQVSYADLVEKELGIRLDKAHTRTDWSRRPLSNEQLQYAADDVRYLTPLYEKQLSVLRKNHRQEWVTEESQAMLDESLYRIHPEDAWRKIKGTGSLRGGALAAAKAVAAWREQCAIRADRPRRWIMDDKTVIALANLRPQSRADMSQIDGLSDKQIDKRGKQLIRIISEAAGTKTDDNNNKGALSVEQRQRVKQLSSAVDQIANELEISKEMLATRRDLEFLVRHGHSERLLQGWRGGVIGDRLRRELEAKI